MLPFTAVIDGDALVVSWLITGCCWLIDDVTLVVVEVDVIIFRDGNLNVVIWGKRDKSVDVVKSKFGLFFVVNISGSWSLLER